MWDNVLMFVVVCGITFLLKKLFSDKPNLIQFKFKFFIFYFLTSLGSGVIWPVFLFRPRNVRNVIIITRILKYITKIYDLKWVLRNGEILAEDRGAVIIANHQSSLDILGLFNIWEIVDKMTVIAKKELFYLWPFGLAAYLGGIEFIDRKNTKGAYKLLDVVSNIMVKKKIKVFVFPEGTRNKDYTKLLPFKKGAFNMAVNSQVPLIPVVFSPYYFINPKKYIFNKEGHVIIKCLEPIPTKGLTNDDIPRLMEEVHAKMEAVYKDLSKEVLSDLPADYPHTTVG